MIIKIKNFKLKTIVGIYDWEQDFQREILINAKIHTNSTKAKISNNISDTIDYDLIINKIKQFVINNKFQLIEKMASDILDLIMEDKRIKKCEIELDKIGVVSGVESFSVTISKSRK